MVESYYVWALQGTSNQSSDLPESLGENTPILNLETNDCVLCSSPNDAKHTPEIRSRKLITLVPCRLAMEPCVHPQTMAKQLQLTQENSSLLLRTKQKV